MHVCLIFLVIYVYQIKYGKYGLLQEIFFRNHLCYFCISPQNVIKSSKYQPFKNKKIQIQKTIHCTSYTPRKK